MLPPNLATALIALVLIIAVLITFVVIYHSVNWKKLKLKRRYKVVKDELTFYLQYTYYGEYSNSERMRKEGIGNILNRFRTNIDQTDGGVLVTTKFNNIYYSMYDLDSQEQMELFKSIYSNTSYTIFISSSDHYWGFPDIEYKKLNDIFFDTNWKVCNDQKYISFSRSHEDLCIRGLYETMDRKPHIYETNGNLSKNFQLFIDKLSMYYNKESLELSVLKYKDPTMLIKFNRKKKLQQIENDTILCM